MLKKWTITGVLHETENNTKYQNVRPHWHFYVFSSDLSNFNLLKFSDNCSSMPLELGVVSASLGVAWSQSALLVRLWTLESSLLPLRAPPVSLPLLSPSFLPPPINSLSSCCQPASRTSSFIWSVRSPVRERSAGLFLWCLNGPTSSRLIRTRGTSKRVDVARLANGSTWNHIEKVKFLCLYNVH